MSPNTSMTYVPEVWGFGTHRGSTLLTKIQIKITHLAKAAIRPGGRNPHAQVAVREMGLKPVADNMALQTMRLFNKCVTMRGRDRDENLLSELQHCPGRCQTHTCDLSRPKRAFVAAVNCLRTLVGEDEIKLPEVMATPHPNS